MRPQIVIIAATLLIGSPRLIGVGGLNAADTTSSGKHPFCSSDELLSESLRQNPTLQQKMAGQERAIRNYVESRSAQRGQQQSAASNFVIPVVVYVVHRLNIALGTDENITDQQVTSQITALNNAFSGQGIQFCLATEQNGTALPGTTPGIIRIPHGLTDHLTSQEPALKALSTLPGDRYLRIWVVKDIDHNSGVAGYARFPGGGLPAWDGIVMRYQFFGDAASCGCTNLVSNYDQGEILAHEVGHYLSLYHIFQGGCTGVSSADCTTAGDLLCDTPQSATPDTGCPTGTVLSCTGSPSLLHNQMNYTDDVCRNAFTPGQETRMLATINTARSLLVSAQNLVYTGVQCASGLNPAFSADNYNPCANQIVTFTALNTAGATYLWDFGDGSPGGSSQVTTHTYATAGPYTVTLTVTSGGNSVSATQQVFVTTCAPINSSQGNWFFGFFGELHFNTGAPQPGNQALSSNTIQNVEACLTQSDSSGNLLFYSDGTRVWNNLHAQVTSTLQGNSSSTQVLSVPDPADPNSANPSSFYVITLAGYISGNTTGGAFSYTKISAVSSNLTLSAVNTPIAPPAGADNRITEMITAIPGCGTDYWIIVHGSYLDTNPAFRHALFVYPLTVAGLGPPTAYSIVGPAKFGQLKASPDGTRIAYGSGDPQSAQGNNPGYAHVLDFNRNTGGLSNPRVVDRYAYGVSFSPNSQLLYLTDSVSGPIENIFQYDLSAANLNATETLVANVPEPYSALQLGPDKKIYVALNNNNNHLAVINYPDQRNTLLAPNSCGYSYNGPFLNIPATATAVSSAYGLPNMIDAQKASSIPANFSFIISSCSTVAFMAPACASSYSWNFGDSATSTAQNPTHVYAVNGTYTVSLTLNGTTTATRTVTIGLPATATIIMGPSQVCATSGNPPFLNYSANAQPGCTYNWTVTGGAISGVSNSNNVDVVWNTFPGTVQLTVTDPATGCSTTGTLIVIQSSSSDLYMKDTMAPDLPEDFGVEPTVSQLLYISRDIWVRTSADTIAGSTNPGPDTMLATDSYYANEHQHQNPTFVNPTTPSHVYVKVRNRGCTPSTGTEKLRMYWADASTGLPWPDTSVWTEFYCATGSGIGPCPLPVIAPGQDYVVEFPWVPPDPGNFAGSHHFCLLARIETVPSPPYGMTSDESQNQWLWQNVAGNNNIAWKNLTVFSGSGKATVIVRNPLRQEAPVELQFAMPGTDSKDHFLLHGDILVDLGDALMKKWRQGEQRPQGFEVAGKTTIKLTDPNKAVLGGLHFAAGEKQTMEVRMQLKPGDPTRPGTSFDFDVIQMAPATRNAKPSAIGGVRYNLIVPEPTREQPWNRFLVCGLVAAVLALLIGIVALGVRHFRARAHVAASKALQR